MKIYLVGGAVRDELLGLPVGERDWVVVGATPDDMLALGYRRADAEFPVFLHPETGEEYALARRETKLSGGYRGFRVDAAPTVSLEADLARRDLTINAMAQTELGDLIDPYGGRKDLRAALLRHVTPAFSEDPVRLLRLARFAALLGGRGFRVAQETRQLAASIVQSGELSSITPERLWREMSKALRADQPWRFFEVLHAAGALEELLPPVARATAGGRGAGSSVTPAVFQRVLEPLCRRSTAIATRFVTVMLLATPGYAKPEALIALVRPGRRVADLLRAATVAIGLFRQLQPGDAPQLRGFVARLRGLHDPERFEELLLACEAHESGGDRGRALRLAARAMRQVSARELAREGLDGARLGRELADRQVRAIATALRDGSDEHLLR